MELSSSWKSQEDVLDILKKVTGSRQIALLRIQYLNEEGQGLASALVTPLKDATDALFDWLQKALYSDEASMKELDDYLDPCLNRLKHLLKIHQKCVSLDPILAEELGRTGSHAQLARLLRYNCDDIKNIFLQEDIMDLQDMASVIAANGTFPLPTSPYSLEELRHRLPLIFEIAPVGTEDSTDDDTDGNNKKSVRILIHQVTTRQSEQADVGFVMWPSAVVLSRWLVTNPSILQHRKTVLELGAGCGLPGLVAGQLLAQQHTPLKVGLCLRLPLVLLSDFNRIVLENLGHNVQLNSIAEVGVVGLDFNEQHGWDCGYWIEMGRKDCWMPQVDVILAADIICQAEDAVAVAKTIRNALRPGGHAYCVCADAAHRFGVDRLSSECMQVGLTVEVKDVSELENGQLLANKGLDCTSGYVEGMAFTMFIISKPSNYNYVSANRSS